MKRKGALLNILLSLLFQVVTIISGLIIPRLIISTFGSSVNGLASSIGQFLNYIALIEGGITGVVSANLYKPLVEKNWEKISSVLVTARAFYRKIGLLFIFYAIAVGLIYPCAVDTGFNSVYVLVLTCVLSIGLLLQYMFSLTMTTLLNADKKVYVVSIVSILLTIGNVILVIIVVKFFPDIILMKVASAALFALKPLVLGIYIRQNYDLNWDVPKDNLLIKQRWNGFAINFAFFIHSSTDITILTLMSDLKTVSVYSVYYLVVSKISALIHAIASGIEPVIGQAYARNDLNKLHQKMDLYEFIIFFSVGIIFSLMALLITPFVNLYTSGVSDTNYYQPVFGMILVFSEALYLLKYPHITLAYAANKFREITIPAYIEAVINIVVSVALVQSLGLVGIAIGTASGMLYRMIFHIHFTSKIIPSRKQTIFYKKLLIIGSASTLAIFVCVFLLPIQNITVITWLVRAVEYGIIFSIVYGLVAVIFFKRELGFFVKYLKKCD